REGGRRRPSWAARAGASRRDARSDLRPRGARDARARVLARGVRRALRGRLRRAGDVIDRRLGGGGVIDIGVIGGTGFYRFFTSREEVTPETPYGAPSAPVTIADFAGRTVGFIPRHGRH